MIDIRKLIVLAKVDEIDQIQSVFTDVTEKLRDLGVHQWDFSYPNKTIINEDIQSKSCYLLKINQRIAAVVSLNQEQDDQYKNVNWDAPEEHVWVIHRLAVHSDFQNRGIATRLCQFLEKLAFENGAKCIRLDAFSKNPYSNRMYLKLGYKAMKELLYFHGNNTPFIAYEKILTSQ